MITQSEKLFERAKRSIPGGVHSPVRAFKGVGGTPRFIREASGAYLTDVDNNRYVDYCLSWGPLLFGHQDPETADALHEALGRGWTFGAADPYSLELAELITSQIPWIEKIRFVNSGTEAVMTACRIARAATQRSKILKFDGSYHGHSCSLLVRAGSGLTEMATPDSAGVSAMTAGETVVAPLDDIEAVREVFAHHGESLAAVILEPIPGNNGLLIQRQGFYEEVISLARKSNALVIFDEVITGFRVGFQGMAGIMNARPDLVTYGKIIGGGFPVGACGGRADLMDLLAPIGPAYQAGTLSGNPVAMIAGLTTLKKILRENPYPRLEKNVQKIASHVKELSRSLSFPMQVQSFASMFWLIFGEVQTDSGQVHTPSQAPSSHKSSYTEVFHNLLNQGVYLAPSAFEISFLSTAHGDEEIEMLLSGLGKALHGRTRG